MQDQKSPLKTKAGQPLRHQNSHWIFERLRQQDEKSFGERNPQPRDDLSRLESEPVD
jgi:hypothetical protein